MCYLTDGAQDWIRNQERMADMENEPEIDMSYCDVCGAEYPECDLIDNDIEGRQECRDCNPQAFLLSNKTKTESQIINAITKIK